MNKRYRDVKDTTINSLELEIAYKKPRDVIANSREAESLLAEEIACVSGPNKMGKPLSSIFQTAFGEKEDDIFGVPTELLVKPSRLSKAEFSLIQHHAEAGYDILKDIPFPGPLAETVAQHHERIDGSGYRGLSGEKILLEARILCVADVVEAMSAHRPYRPSLGTEAALKGISDYRGVFYDADVVDACLKVFETCLKKLERRVCFYENSTNASH